MSEQLLTALVTQVAPILLAVTALLGFVLERGKAKVRLTRRVSRYGGSADYKDRVLALAEERIVELESQLAQCEKERSA